MSDSGATHGPQFNAGRPVYDHGETGELGDMATLLAGVEGAHHKRGWDETAPTLYQVCRPPGVDGYEVAAHPLEMPDVHPRDELATMARVLNDPIGGEVLVRQIQMYPWPPFAHLAVFEAWQGVATAEEFAAELAGHAAKSTTSLADTPGSVEIRIGLAVVGDVVMVVNRERGHEPRFSRDSERATEWGGPLIESLCAVDAAARAAYERHC